MKRNILFLLFILLPQVWFAQGALNAAGDFILILLFSLVLLVVDVIMLFAYFFARKKILSILLFIAGGVLVIFALTSVINLPDSFFLLLGIIYIIVGTLSIVVPLLRKPV